jgi:hypothetical protein
LSQAVRGTGNEDACHGGFHSRVGKLTSVYDYSQLA